MTGCWSGTAYRKGHSWPPWVWPESWRSTPVPAADGGLGLVRGEQREGVGRDAGERGVDVGGIGSAPGLVVDAGHPDAGGSQCERDVLVAQDVDAQGLPVVHPGVGLLRDELVVAADGEDPQRGVEVAERSERVGHLADRAVDEVAAQHDDVGVLPVDLVDDAAGEARVTDRADVQVGDAGDAQAVEPTGCRAGR